MFLCALTVVGYGFFALGGVSNYVGIENPTWWQKIGNIFSSTVAEVDKNNPEDDLNAQFPLPKKEGDRVDILIMGIRGADDPDGGLLTDTMMLLSFDKKTKKVAVVSLPRDIYTEMPTMSKGKINEIYERGLAQKSSLDFTKKVFSRLTGVNVDNIIIFDFQSFKGIIDTLGGVDVTLAKPFEEKTQWGYEFSLPAGQNHLDGEKALYYVRSRYSSNDFDRARRQQEVLLAIKTKVLALGLFKNPIQIASLVSQLKKNITTDLDILDTKKMLDLASAMNAAPLTTKTLSTDNLLMQTIQNGIYILLPKDNDWGPFRIFFQNILTS